MRAPHAAAMIGNVTLDSTFAILEPATGHCPVCRGRLKWAEIGHVDDPDGGRIGTRLLVCDAGHQTAVVDPAYQPRTAAP
jgi:hypothetical protein